MRFNNQLSCLPPTAIKITLGASEAAARRVHLHEPSQPRDMDVRPLRLHRGQHCPLSCQQVSAAAKRTLQITLSVRSQFFWPS